MGTLRVAALELGALAHVVDGRAAHEDTQPGAQLRGRIHRAQLLDRGVAVRVEACEDARHDLARRILAIAEAADGLAFGDLCELRLELDEQRMPSGLAVGGDGAEQRPQVP